jgi:L-lactate dehydrogenase complex protein LldG
LEKSKVSERENILARVREALMVLAPMPGHAHDDALAPHPPSSATRHSSPSQWLPLVGDSFEDRLAMFRRNSADLKADFHLVNSREELSQKLLELRDREGWKKIGSHGGELTDAAYRALGLPICRTDQRYDAADLESCDAGITECDSLVAQTGSVLVTSRSAGGRALSVLPPHHVVLAKREQLLADLPDAFALLKQKYSSNYPSFMSLITGPSRTGDIERILVLGAHGPKKLTIFCL